MSKGYVYIMTTAVDGIIKIGKSDNWNRRCQSELETNGYRNMNSLKTYFVVQCEDYSEIESIMHDIFRESRVIGTNNSKTELFAIDKDRARRVLAKMGTQVFPEISNTKSDSINQPSYYAQFWDALDVELDKYLPKSTNSPKKCRSYYQGNRLHANNVYIAIDFRSTSKICVNAIISKKNINTIYAKVFKDKNNIESKLGYSLLWDEKFSTNGSSTYIRIAYYIDNNPNTIDNTIVQNVANKAVEMFNVFKQY